MTADTFSCEPAHVRMSIPVAIGSPDNGTHQVMMGGKAPVVVQSMTNTDSADVAATVAQVAALAQSGSEIVRLTVDREDAARAVPHIKDALHKQGVHVPLVGDFHYIGHQLLRAHPACAEALDKYRINPGNVGFREKRDRQFSEMIESALTYGKPVRIGVNGGSLDQELLAALMDDNTATAMPRPPQDILREALIQSAVGSAERAESLGLGADKIVLSCKVSNAQELITLYREMATRCSYALHLGLTEAGTGLRGVIATSAALSVLLQEGIGDTIRYSLTPEPGGDRTREVKAARLLLQSMGYRAFAPDVVACPGCGRTTSTVFQELATTINTYLDKRMSEWRITCPAVASLKIAVMGCIVNGPGESRQADIGISLPGTGEHPSAPVFVDGEKVVTLRGATIAQDFQNIIEEYVAERFGNDPSHNRPDNRSNNKS